MRPRTDLYFLVARTMKTMSHQELLLLQERDNHLQACRSLSDQGEYQYQVNGISVDYATFKEAVEIIRNPRNCQSQMVR